jgi:hypothetical protein
MCISSLFDLFGFGTYEKVVTVPRRPFPDAHNVFCGTISQKKFTDKTEEGIRWAFYNISILMYFCELVKCFENFFGY